jgi:hypothetical protein
VQTQEESNTKTCARHGINFIFLLYKYKMSSLSFIGNATSYLRIPNVSDLNFGTGDFTIEWYQYQTDSNPFPRVFQIGEYIGSGISIGVSIEGGTFYYWRNGSPTGASYLTPLQYKNTWVHFAISRASGVTQIFMNGILMLTTNDTTDFSSSDDLVIGNESTPSNAAAFGGYMAYFSWVKGLALRTANFTVPNNFPSLTNNLLLLMASSFSGTLGSTTVNNGDNVSTVSEVPPGFDSTPPPPPPPPPLPAFTPPTNMKKSLFSNNAMVFYKPGSLAPGGVGGVGNASVKARRI